MINNYIIIILHCITILQYYLLYLLQLQNAREIGMKNTLLSLQLKPSSSPKTKKIKKIYEIVSRSPKNKKMKGTTSGEKTNREKRKKERKERANEITAVSKI